MTPIGLVFNKLLNLVICLDCGIANGTKAVVEHIHTIHGDAKVHFDHTTLQSIFNHLGVEDHFDLKDLPNPCPQIEGLLVTKAYMCSICHHLRGTMESMRLHHSTKHQDIPNPRVWQQVSAQQIHHTHHTPYFCIYPRSTQNPATPLTQEINRLQKECSIQVANYNIATLDPRQVSPWLNATQWHIHVAPYNYQHLITLVKCPTQQEADLAFLSTAVESYTSNADKAIDTLSLLACQVINSPINT